MAIRVVRLGSPRTADEGLRLGTVRRPPRGVPKAEHASRDFYDLWLPDLAPSEALLKQALSVDDERGWRSFEKKLPCRDEAPSSISPACTACRAFAPDEFLGRVLLRGRNPLPPVGAESIAAGSRRSVGVSSCVKSLRNRTALRIFSCLWWAGSAFAPSRYASLQPSDRGV